MQQTYLKTKTHGMRYVWQNNKLKTFKGKQLLNVSVTFLCTLLGMVRTWDTNA